MKCIIEDAGPNYSAYLEGLDGVVTTGKTVEEIKTAVAKKYSVTVEQIHSQDRQQALVTPRQLAMYIARKYSSNTLHTIADSFKKTHATIVHGVKTIEKRIDVEADLKQQLEEIIAEFGLMPNDKID